MTRGLLVGMESGVAVVTLDRPERRNALDRPLLDAVSAVLTELDADAGVHAIVLTGSDPAFCSGVDLKAAAHGVVARPQDGPPLPAISTPLVAAVNGAAVTGGLELVLACDFAIASERASFGDTHARLGALPFWGLSVLLPEAVGVRRARQLSLTGTPIDANTALRWGLVNEVVPHEQLLPRALEICAEIGRSDRRTVRLLLEMYRAGRPHASVALEWERTLAELWHGHVLDEGHWRAPESKLPPAPS